MEEIFNCEITGYGYDGEGVARLNGKVVFLPYTLMGEKVGFIKLKEKSSFINGKAKEILNPSNHRCPAPCPYFQKCGGCTLQHAIYAHELEIKKNLLKNQLKKVGYFGNIDIVGSPKEYGYRNKIRLFVGENGLSLKRRGSNNLVAVDKCLLVQDKINDAIEKINKFISIQSLENVYKEIVLRQENEKLLINFIKKNQTEVNYQGLYLLLGECGIFETFNGQTIHKLGIKYLSSEEMGLKCEFGMTSFHQVNSFLTEKLYQSVVDNLVGKTILNCYSGAGVLSGVIAKQGKNVVGIELGQSEHDDAEKLKKSNNLINLTNICGDCADVLANYSGMADTIIVDPPRSGMAEYVCEAIDSMEAKRLVYVSCNSATLVRDLQRLTKYAVEKVILFDMFAKTGEYEVVCICSRRKNPLQ